MKKLIALLLCTWMAFAEIEPLDNMIALGEMHKITLQGIVLVGDKTEIGNRKVQRGIHIRGVTIPGSRREFEKSLAPYLDRTLSRDLIVDIKRHIIAYYKDHHRPMLLVEVPEQDVTEGVVAFYITNAKVGKVVARGNQYFSNSQLLDALDLDRGDEFDEEVLLNNVAWMNQNPFRYSEIVVTPGNMQGHTDIELVTQDRLPWRFYAGGDNTGVEVTGAARYFAGINCGNTWGRGDLLTFQFTTSQDFHEFRSYFANYASFLPWKHKFILYGGYSQIHPDISDFNSNGKNGQVSTRYVIPFKPLYTPFAHQFTFGFDYKYLNSNLFFAGEAAEVSVIVQQVNIFEPMVGYQLENRGKRNDLTFDVELYGSPGKWLPHQTNEDYERLRAHAKNTFGYGKVSLGDVYTFSSRCALAMLLRGQGATGTLLPSEQFGLGGYNTVRGYREREVISDNAAVGNLEFRTPPITLFAKTKNELVFLAFVDAGWGHNYHPIPTTNDNDWLLGVGPGIRYTIYPYLTVRVDYGVKLHDTQFEKHGFGRFHVSAIVSY